MKPEDGVVSVALGLGRTVVEGGKALRFSPSHPAVLPQFGDHQRLAARTASASSTPST